VLLALGADQADRADADLFVQTGAGRATGRGVAIERGDAWSPYGEREVRTPAAATAAAGVVARTGVGALTSYG